MTWELDIRNFMIKNQDCIDIPKTSNTKIAMKYYEKRGITDTTSVKDWLVGLAEQKYPEFTTLIKTIKKVRKTKKEWRKEYEN